MSVPDPRPVLRLPVLVAFLLTVALALCLLGAAWPVVALVMGIAWIFVAGFEWAARRHDRDRGRGAPSESAALLDAPVPAPPDNPELQPAPPATRGARRDAGSGAVGEPHGEAEAEAKRSAAPPAPERRPLRPVPPPPPQAPPSSPAGPPQAAERSAAPLGGAGVVDLRRRATVQPRHWNLWDLERLAREELHRDPLRFEALSYLFVHLRQFASPDGSLPTEFDGLVRESFGDLLEQRR